MIVFPPEPPVAMADRQNGAEPVKGAPVFGAAQRPLPASTVLTFATIDGRRSGDTIIVVPAGELRASAVGGREEWGLQRGKKP